MSQTDYSKYSWFEVPTNPFNQYLSTSLAGVTYYILLQWNPASECWIMQIQDQNQNVLASGVPLITGADLLAQLDYLGIGGGMIVQSDNDPQEVPNYSSLGSTGHLYFGVPPAS